MLEILAKLDEQKRTSVAVVAILMLVCICYFSITKRCIARLDTAKAKHQGLLTEYTGTESEIADYSKLQKLVEDGQKQLAKQKLKCFGKQQAFQFIENINAMSQTYNLKPISKVVSKPKKIVQEDSDDEQQSLEILSAEITVTGDFFDIVDFTKDLTDRSEKVCIKNMSITLSPKEEFTPRVTFQVALLLTDSTVEAEK
jgi:Tfp pilus assembly protein PilO